MSHPRPRIGVTRWEDVPGEPIEQYWDRVRAAGGEPVDLRGPTTAIDQIDGLILTGGVDVVPARYGATAHPKAKLTNAGRDDFEAHYLTGAMERDLPVLAICRGHQLLNVVLGGTLLQHIEGGGHRADYRSEGFPSRWHTVRIEASSKLREIFGADEVQVNSRHHQAVTREHLAPNATAVAISPEGHIDAIESPAHRWLLGVQWHPERAEPNQPHFAPWNARLFAALVEEARKVVAGA